jgi:hypothetical protein
MLFKRRIQGRSNDRVVSLQKWRAARRREFEVDLRRLKKRPAPAGRAERRNGKSLWRYWWSRRVTLSLICVAALFIGHVLSGPWPLTVMIRHLVAARNCDAARLVGLAPANRGEPGYWPHNDADHDGIACEPWRGRR